MKAQTKKDFLKIGWYQIAGGATGVLSLLFNLVVQIPSSGLLILVNVFALSLFCFSGYCGALCLKFNPSALKLSLINQFLQVVGISVVGCAYAYYAGVYLSAGLDLDSFNFTFGLGISKFDFKINSDEQFTVANINIIAIVLVVWIDKLNKRFREEEVSSEIASIKL